MLANSGSEKSRWCPVPPDVRHRYTVHEKTSPLWSSPIHNLRLHVRKHQVNPRGGTLYKIPDHR